MSQKENQTTHSLLGLLVGIAGTVVAVFAYYQGFLLEDLNHKFEQETIIKTNTLEQKHSNEKAAYEAKIERVKNENVFLVNQIAQVRTEKEQQRERLEARIDKLTEPFLDPNSGLAKMMGNTIRLESLQDDYEELEGKHEALIKQQAHFQAQIQTLEDEKSNLLEDKIAYQAKLEHSNLAIEAFAKGLRLEKEGDEIGSSFFNTKRKRAANQKYNDALAQYRKAQGYGLDIVAEQAITDLTYKLH